MNTFAFFQNLVLHISSSLDLAKAMRATFSFLSKELPIVGISLHRFRPHLKAAELNFLVTEEGFYELGTFIPLPEKAVEDLVLHEKNNDLAHGKSWDRDTMGYALRNALAGFIPPKDRSYLVGILRAGDHIVGHLCLVGREKYCFSPEHEDLLELMRAPLGLAMMNLLQHRKTEELRARLNEHRLQLAGEISLLQEKSIIGKDGGLLQTIKMIKQLEGSNAPVLITGETGTGKEVIANAVQAVSAKKDGPFVKINCGAIPDTLIDSELFGYQKGAFTGATADRPGKFEQASGGTLFLDEIGDLAPQSQVRLLRVLQDQVVQRVGGTRSIKVDVRIIAATHRPLENMLQAGTFREDLYYRLNVFPLKLPALRDRTGDIPLLVQHFIKTFCVKMNMSHKMELDVEAMQQLHDYSWPGNIRELKNLVERALTLYQGGKLNIGQYLPKDAGWYLGAEDSTSYVRQMIQEEIATALASGQLAGGGETVTPQHSHGMELYTPPLAEKSSENNKPQNPSLALDDVTKAHILAVLKQCKYKISGRGGAAELLQVNPSTLRKRMEKLNISFIGKDRIV